jgi:glycosyltransferase involved in cell wall biosynthesis
MAAHFSLHALPVLDLVGPDLPLVFHFHGPWALESKVEGQGPLRTRLKALIERVVYGRAQRFIVLSAAFRDLLVESYDVSPESVHVVPGGVDVPRFDRPESPSAARRELGWPPDRPIILSVRRLVRRVGLESLVTAMTAVRKHRPEALLLMAGRGPLADALQAQIEAAGLEENVRLLGFVPDEALPLAYRAADLSIMPTRALEGFGLSAVESLAAGTPVLVTPVGGLPEVVRDLSEQLIVASESPAALADRITAVLSGDLDVPSTAACQQYARRRFAWPVIASQVNDVYQQVTS